MILLGILVLLAVLMLWLSPARIVRRRTARDKVPPFAPPGTPTVPDASGELAGSDDDFKPGGGDFGGGGASGDWSAGKND
jgi:hypothetical protein